MWRFANVTNNIPKQIKEYLNSKYNESLKLEFNLLYLEDKFLRLRVKSSLWEFIFLLYTLDDIYMYIKFILYIIKINNQVNEENS